MKLYAVPPFVCHPVNLHFGTRIFTIGSKNSGIMVHGDNGNQATVLMKLNRHRLRPMPGDIFIAEGVRPVKPYVCEDTFVVRKNRHSPKYAISQAVNLRPSGNETPPIFSNKQSIAGV